ncbi:molybdopterin guanine dinucleotide biosynthesis protein MoaE [Marinobacterium zhoushanense]|uniref:Molybdopterin synthase catalytic subunit n=1 Tax=Marinobacterium zhoushanense TaxID=1679163 RepID=A0ABQ1K8D9_9GAMM|nr:molybdopterin synthase catalytic subunit MoaE [Marinobacterium zhoushanense]GGB90811.1 molybdopterin guanine dinucleotide biosynthesis protein MoaE [Marinobacterium zhoushanense]
MPLDDVAVQAEDFDLALLSQRLRGEGAAQGAIVTFTGLVRELMGDHLLALELEHYPGMTEKSLHKIVEQARERWGLGRVLIRHRVGRLLPGDNIVYVGVTSAHRKAAFEAAQFIMDYLKRDAPFWKKEILDNGEHWVEQKASDLSAAAAWQGDDSGDS